MKIHFYVTGMSHCSPTQAYNEIKFMLIYLGSSRSSDPIGISVSAKIVFFSSSISKPPYFHLESCSSSCSESVGGMAGFYYGLHKGEVHSLA